MLATRRSDVEARGGADVARWDRSSILLLIGVGVALVVALTLVHEATTGKHLLDLQVYRKGAWAFDHGRDPYGRGLPGPTLPYTYTPFSTLAFSPLAMIPFHIAGDIHTVVSLVALFVSVFLVVRELWGKDLAPRQIVAMSGLAMVAAYWSEPVLQTLGFGQINLVLMGLIVTDFLAVRDRRFAGVLIGIAAGVKLTPLIFVAYLLLTKRRRAAITASISAALTVVVGWLFMPTATSEFFLHLAWDPRRVGHIGYVGNQSVYGMWTRVLHHDMSAKPFWQASALVLGVVGLWAAIKVHDRFGEPAGFGVCAITGLLVSPISWSHHWVLWFVPAMGLARAAWVRRSRALAAAAVIWTLPFYIGPFWRVPRDRWREFSRVGIVEILASTYSVLGMAALGILVAWLVRHRDPAPDRDEVVPAG